MHRETALLSGDGRMIMRVFQVVTRPGKEEEFGRFFHETAIPLMKSTAGIVDVLPGAPRPETPREFSFVMLWESLDALKAHAASPHMTAYSAKTKDMIASRVIHVLSPV